MSYVTCTPEFYDVYSNDLEAKRYIEEWIENKSHELAKIPAVNNSVVSLKDVQIWAMTTYVLNGKNKTTLDDQLFNQSSFSIKDAEAAYAMESGSYFPKDSAFEIASCKAFKMAPHEQEMTQNVLQSDKFIRSFALSKIDELPTTTHEIELMQQIDDMVINGRNIRGIQIYSTGEKIGFFDVNQVNDRSFSVSDARMAHINQFITDWLEAEPNALQGKAWFIQNARVKLDDSIYATWEALKSTDSFYAMKALENLSKSIVEQLNNSDSKSSLKSLATVERQGFHPGRNALIHKQTLQGSLHLMKLIEKGATPRNPAISTKPSVSRLSSDSNNVLQELGKDFGALQLLAESVKSKSEEVKNKIKERLVGVEFTKGTIGSMNALVSKAEQLDKQEILTVLNSLNIDPRVVANPIYDKDKLLKKALGNNIDVSDCITDYSIDKNKLDSLFEKIGLSLSDYINEEIRVTYSRTSRGEEKRSLDRASEHCSMQLQNTVNTIKDSPAFKDTCINSEQEQIQQANSSPSYSQSMG